MWSVALRVTSRLACGVALLATLHGTARLAGAQESPSGPDGYSHYWPGACLEAIDRNDQFMRRAQVDTGRYDVAGDTMLTSSVEVAKTCVATLAIDSVRPRDLIFLARVYLAAGDPDAAEQAIQRRLAIDAARPDSTRAHTLADIVSAYLNAKPWREGQAEAYMSQLDTMSGPDAAYWQFNAHDAIGQRGRLLGNDSLLKREATAMIAVGGRLSPHDREEFGGRLVSAYWYLADLKGTETASADSAKVITAQARADLGEVKNLDRALLMIDSLAGFFGKPAPSVYADTWYPAADLSPSDTVHPRPGKVSLIVLQGFSRYVIPIFRRLQAVVPDTVDITFIHNSYGYFGSKGPLSPAEEAVAVESSFRNDLNGPGSLAIVVPRIEVLPDGRRIPVPTRNELLYGARVGVSILAVDRNGTIRRTWSGFDSWTEFQIEDVLRKIQ